jgi:hypothetical protein
MQNPVGIGIVLNADLVLAVHLTDTIVNVHLSEEQAKGLGHALIATVQRKEKEREVANSDWLGAMGIQS